MHVGHLRSAVIGEALCRLLAFCGANVYVTTTSATGAPSFGKLIWAYRSHLDPAVLEADPLAEFERLYKVGQAASETDPVALESARSELVKLQAGDSENFSIWRRINEASLGAFQPIYDQLGIRFDLTLGESFYNDKVARVYSELSGPGWRWKAMAPWSCSIRNIPGSRPSP